MKYILLEQNTNKVLEIIPEFDPVFPNVPISERYTKVFIESLLKVDDSIDVEQNWIYNKESNTFSEYVEPVLSNIELREQAYQNLAIIEWEGSMITVDKANQLWLAYTTEGNTEKASQITTLVAEAKSKIREMYPDEGTV